MILEKILISLAIVIILVLIVLVVVFNKRISEKLKLLKLKTLIALHKDEEAKKYALKFVEKFPQSYMAHKLLAQLYEKEGNFNIALDEYIRVVDLNSTDLQMHYKVADLLYKTQKNEEAIIMLQDLLRMKPDYVDATKLLGNILYDEERFKEAISIYTEALKYNPTDYDLYYNMGMAFTRLNDFQKAKEFYEKAATLNTYLYNGQYNLALIAMIQGEFEEAEDYLNQALQEEDLEPVGYFYLGLIAMLKNQKDKAVAYLNIALELDKNLEEKISSQSIFKPIEDQLRIPNETRKIKITLSKKELINNKYLEDMYDLVDSLHGSKVSAEDEEKEINRFINYELENEKER